MDAGALRWGDGRGRDGDDAIVRELALGAIIALVARWRIGGRARKLGMYLTVLHFIFFLLSIERFSLYLITYLRQSTVLVRKADTFPYLRGLGR